MPNHCCASGCKANYKNGPKVKVFSFPRDPDLLAKWLHALKRKDFTPSEHSKMPGHCCVPYCNANYPSGPRVSIFSFPKDEELLEKWISVIPKQNFQPTPNSKVCQRHFKSEDILTTTTGYDPKRKLTITVPLKNYRLKSGAVPSIFEDLPVKQSKYVKNATLKDNKEKDNIDSSVGTSIQKKNIKKSLSPVHEMDKTNKTSKHDEERKGTMKSPKKSSMTEQSMRSLSPKKGPLISDHSTASGPSKKVSSTTDRPIIAVIKAEDRSTDEEKSPEKMDEDNDCMIESPVSKPFSLPSPFKNLPNVSVCLKEEDRVPLTRELKGVKRSSSTGSNSSTGSADAQKSAVNVTKRKKIEKPAPVVIGRQNDCYCWVCHRENIVLCCIACPRAYHNKCAGEMSTVTPDWVCPECQRILAAENVDTRSSTLSEISLDKLCALLKLCLNKIKLRAPIAFHQPVSLEHYPLYLHYVIHPMDFSLIEKNIKQKMYGCTEAFSADVKWIAHNSCVFNGTQHPLSTNAKNLVKACDQDMQEIEVCPDCFVHSVVRNKYWFSEVCRKPHPLVWAKLKGFPYWPAKVVRIVDGNVDARFFGAHDRAWVPVSQCYHLSKEMPTTSKPKKKGNYEVALDELNVHVHLLIQKFGCFEYAPYRTNFNTQNKYFMYHGIDIDKVSKEDFSVDNSVSQSEMNFYNSEKENIYASSKESDAEKPNSDENSLCKSQSETQLNNSFKMDKLPKSFLLKERDSTASVLSEKEISMEESSDQRTLTEHNKTDEKQTDNSKQSAVKEPEKISDSDQLRKLELALERIKGYVSLNDDVEKECVEDQSEVNEVKEIEMEKSTPEEVPKDNTEKSMKLSPLLKKIVSLPLIKSSSAKENVEDVSIQLQGKADAKKTDSFFLKLNQTIESCKAKLGISEINVDTSSDESAGEENASKSDEDEDDSSASEAEDEEVSEEEEEGENMEASDEEAENDEDEKDKDESEEDSDEDNEDSESDESNSQSSDTDIECISAISSQNPEIAYVQKCENSVNELNSVGNGVSKQNENNIKDMTMDSNEAIITNPDMQVPEVTIEDSGSLQLLGENSSSESSNEVRGNSDSLPNEQCSEGKSAQSVISPKQSSVNPISTSPGAKDNNSNVDSVEINDRTGSRINSNVNRNQTFSASGTDSSAIKTSSLAEVSIGEQLNDVNSNNNMKENSPISHAENSPKNEPEDEDDDIFICTPTRPKSPPVIVLDDDQENEESSASDTFAVKSPPYSTSVESLSNEEVPVRKANSGDERGNAPGKTVSVNNRYSDENLLLEMKSELNEKGGVMRRTSDTESPTVKRKRKLSSDTSSCSEDDIQIVTPIKRAALTGAIRTFNKPNNSAQSLKPVTPTVETVKRNLEKESLNQLNKSPVPTEGNEMEINTPPQEKEPSVPQNSENLLKSPMASSPIVDTSNLSDKDKEILYLRGKLNCIMTAYKIQSWKCTQEREELRHNMNLIIMEMRASLEADKKQAIEALVQKFDEEKQKCIDETKLKQWCANCLTESRYACCWNTSYCSVDCQKHHFPVHRNSCTQVKNKNIEIVEVKKSTASKPSENNENKKVFILNMKSPDNAQQIPASKSQILMPAKNALQIATSNSSNNNIQILLAPVKSPTEPVATSAPTTTANIINPKDKNLPDSSQIIHQVRNKVCDLGTAISLLKKKNIESSLSLTNKAEVKEPKQQTKEETNLEEIYFPSPPRVTFEGYDAAVPDPNLIIPENEEADDPNCDAITQDSELSQYMSPERDVVLSDSDSLDNEMFNIGHGVDVKAKLLNKCLVYGQTAKKLTRCLMEVIFPDIRLLASCSAFGQKSNVTKFTRAALPTRKVHAIIDYVRKRFPDASRSEIVLAMNMKCKEARVLVNKKVGGKPRRIMARRILAKETESDIMTTVTTSATATVTTTIATLPSSAPSISQIIASPIKTSPNVVCVKSSSNQPQVFPYNLSNKPHSVPNILRCSSQILLHRPKHFIGTVGNAAVLQPSPQPKKSETVKNLLANKVNLSMGNLSKDGKKLVMAIDTLKPSTASSQLVTVCNAPITASRPLIIIGQNANAVRPSTVQHPALPVLSHIKK